MVIFQKQMERGFRGMFFTDGRHFVVVVNNDNGLVLLDSFKDGPEPISMEDVNKMIESSFQGRVGGGIDTIGIFG